MKASVYLALDRARDAIRTASALEGTLDLTPFQAELLKAKTAIEAAISVCSRTLDAKEDHMKIRDEEEKKREAK